MIRRRPSAATTVERGPLALARPGWRPGVLDALAVKLWGQPLFATFQVLKPQVPRHE